MTTEAKPRNVRLSGDLPSGPHFDTVVAVEAIVVKVDDRICAAHPRWMTRPEAAVLAESLLTVLSAGADDGR